MSEAMVASTEGIAAVLFGPPVPAFVHLCDTERGHYRLAHKMLTLARKEVRSTSFVFCLSVARACELVDIECQ